MNLSPSSAARTRLTRIFLPALAGLSLAACNPAVMLVRKVVSGGPHPHVVHWKSLVVTASPDANQNSPVALDLVFVRDAALVEQLQAMPAARWFATRADTQRSFPEGVGVISLEVVPSQSLRLEAKAFADQPALAVFAFANYAAPGDHRERLVPTAASYQLQLGPRGFKASPPPAADAY